MQYHIALSLLAALPSAHCIAFGGPVPTNTSPYRALQDLGPKPTTGPSVEELRRRATNYYPETCGWINMDLSSPVACGLGATCMLYTTSGFGMAGCCDTSNMQNCYWAKSCVDDTDYRAGKCDRDCMLNSFIRKCTYSASPYCVSWTYANDDVKDYGCGTIPVSTYKTVYQEATDTYYDLSSSMTLPTISGSAVTGYDDTSTATDSTQATAGATTKSKTKTKKKLPLGLIVGAAAAGLFLIAIVVGLIIFCCVKAKKRKALAANQQAVNAAQASRPQSSYNPVGQPMVQQPPPPMPPTPQIQPGMNGYFKPAVPQQQAYDAYNQPADPQKFNPQPQVHEYVPSPISNPASPAPPYVQPYSTMTPPLPTHSPAPYQNREPRSGAQEVEAVSVPHAQPGQQSQVYEMGSGK